jgi:ribosome-associated translation inhibitor RaiA
MTSWGCFPGRSAKKKEDTVVKVVFKNLEKSDLVRKITAEKVERTINKFSELAERMTTVIVSRENSHDHKGVHQFSAKLLIQGQGKAVVLEKRAETLYQAVAMVTDRALEILHRSLSKQREIFRHKRRRMKAHLKWQPDFSSS